MILVTGAAGHLGSAVIQQLLTKIPASQIAALARDAGKASGLKAKGIDIRLGSYDDVESLDAAMRGIEKVLLVSGSDQGDPLRQHKNVVDAARKAGVRCIAYTGRSLKDRDSLANELMKRHFQTEDYLKESGLTHILFRNALYMDTIPAFGGNVLAAGINLPAGDGRVAFALRSEQGEAIANVLAQSVSGDSTYRLTGPEAWSYRDVASTLSELSGKDVRYTPVETSAFEAQMKARGVPGPQIEKIVAFQTDIRNGQEEEVTPELEELLGRRPASLREGLKTLFRL